MNLKCTTLVIMVGNVMVEADMEVEWCRLKIKVDFCSVRKTKVNFCSVSQRLFQLWRRRLWWLLMLWQWFWLVGALGEGGLL